MNVSNGAASARPAALRRRTTEQYITGGDAEEFMHKVVVCVKAGLTKAQLDATLAIHPTMAEEPALMRQYLFNNPLCISLNVADKIKH